MTNSYPLATSSWDEKEANGYSANLVPVENQLLSGSESEQENNLVEEYEEEVVEQDEDEYEDEYEYEDELEYVEVKGASEGINKKKKLYMDSDFSDQIETQNTFNQTDEEKNVYSKQRKQSNTNLTSKRPIQNATETLDVEPVDEKKINDNEKSEKFEIDDPW